MVRRGLNNIKNPNFKLIVRETTNELIKNFRENLVSIILFGSVARGTATNQSDIDIIVVAENFPRNISGRIDMLLPILNKVYSKIQGRKPFIQFHPLRPNEAEKFRPIYLDVLTDGIILYDKNDFMRKVLNRMQRKLTKLGAKKVYLKDGSWMWILKPGLKPGEVIEI